MRRFLLLLVSAMLVFATQASAQPVTYVYTPLGYQQITPVPTGTSLTVPLAARIAQICVATQAVTYRDDGTAPTTTVGMPVPAGTCFQYSGNLTAIQFIQVTGSAVLNVSYYR